MDDRGDCGRAARLLTQLLRDGEWGERAKTEESETSGVWRGLRFFSRGQSVLLSPLSPSLSSRLCESGRGWEGQEREGVFICLKKTIPITPDQNFL